jgi:hypothetical protein
LQEALWVFISHNRSVTSRQAVPGRGYLLWRLRCSAWGRARLRLR